MNSTSIKKVIKNWFDTRIKSFTSKNKIATSMVFAQNSKTTPSAKSGTAPPNVLSYSFTRITETFAIRSVCFFQYLSAFRKTEAIAKKILKNYCLPLCFY